MWVYHSILRAATDLLAGNKQGGGKEDGKGPKSRAFCASASHGGGGIWCTALRFSVCLLALCVCSDGVLIALTYL